MDQIFIEILLLLGSAVVFVTLFQRLQIPSSLAYLLVGLLLGPYTDGPIIDTGHIQSIAEFGIIFLLFTIGLNFSLSRMLAQGRHVLLLGTGQVVLTTILAGGIAWFTGLSPTAAFVIGAVFAQSSSTIITKQLAEQGEDHSRHGQLGITISVFQDVTSVPFLVLIPVLGSGVGAFELTTSLSFALGQAVLAFLLVFLSGRWLLRPLFHLVAARRSAELFTLTVIFVCLIAAWTTYSLGLSMPFGGFLAGMVLAETEFKHQVESTIRPFRDVLLGLFFIGIGMLFNPGATLDVWHLALSGTLILLLSKIIIIVPLFYGAGIDLLTSWRTALTLAVGGEFGFALLAIAIQSKVIGASTGQVALSSVLLSMIIAPFLIRYNYAIADFFASSATVRKDEDAPQIDIETAETLDEHVIIYGYGRIGQSVGNLLEDEHIPFVAVDLDPSIVREAHIAGEPVYIGNSANPDLLETLGIARARLLVISHEDLPSSLEALRHARNLRPDIPIMVRTRDETHVEELREAGATEVVPETLEASLMIASQALILLDVPFARVMRRIEEQRKDHYRLLRELFPSESMIFENPEFRHADRLRPIKLPEDSPAIGHCLADFELDGVVVTALVREGKRQLSPSPDTTLEAGDVLVLFGSPEDLDRISQELLQ